MIIVLKRETNKDRISSLTQGNPAGSVAEHPIKRHYWLCMLKSNTDFYISSSEKYGRNFTKYEFKTSVYVQFTF